MKHSTKLKLKIFGAIAAAIILLSIVLADEAQARPPWHNPGTTTTSTSVTNVTNVDTGVSQSDLDEATAKALSCDQSFYMGTQRWQVGIQGAVYQGNSALCVGLAKVVGPDKDVMVNFSVVPDEDDDMEDWGYQGGVLFFF